MKQTEHTMSEKTQKIFAKQCTFMLAAADVAQFPESVISQDGCTLEMIPEIAFIGRSNVGKSSLINALTGRKSLARTSNTPGRTQQIVFFNLSGFFIFADLPGYGHAKAPLEVVNKWKKLVQDYLTKRKEIRCVLVLIDSRHGLKQSDFDMLAMLNKANVRYAIVLTKTDCVKKEEVSRMTQNTQNLIRARDFTACAGVFSVSSHSKEGIDSLQEMLAKFVP